MSRLPILSRVLSIATLAGLLGVATTPARAGDFCLEFLPPTPGIAGETNMFRLIGWDRGESGTATIVYGLSVGSTAVPGCPGLTVDIRRPAIGGTADLEGGSGGFVTLVPDAASGLTVYLQAVMTDTCCRSNLLITTFQ